MQEPASEQARVHHTVVIVGGGAAGISVAAMLRRRRRRISIAIIEPSDTHAYQSGWTMVGAGQLALKETLRPEAELIPPNVTWIRAAVARLLPDENAVVLEDGGRIVYGYLIACPGLALRWDRIEGLRDALGHNGVCSTSSAVGAAYSWSCIRSFVGGVALFTQPATPGRSTAAAHNIMCLAADHWRRAGRLEHSRIAFCVAGQTLFGVPFFVPALQNVIDRYGITTRYGQELIAIDGRTRMATFRTIDADGTARNVRHKFDMIHVTPPRGPPDIIRHSSLADASGWIAVDHASLRHVRYGNVFGLGDAVGTGNAGSAAAVRMQVPVVSRNLLALLAGKPMPASYDGYDAWPLTTSIGRAMLAESTHDGAITPSLPLDPRIPRRIAWWLKMRVLPGLYWDKMLRGKKPTIRHRQRRFGRGE